MIVLGCAAMFERQRPTSDPLRDTGEQFPVTGHRTGNQAAAMYAHKNSLAGGAVRHDPHRTHAICDRRLDVVDAARFVRDFALLHLVVDSKPQATMRSVESWKSG